MTGVNVDITARKSAEETLRQLAEAHGMERFRLSFEEAPFHAVRLVIAEDLAEPIVDKQPMTIDACLCDS